MIALALRKTLEEIGKAVAIAVLSAIAVDVAMELYDKARGREDEGKGEGDAR